ncbi:D-aminoacyl-tRNA deacylase [Synoicihabitans lomoniglobus]|uniref:D-aminoacyl-tRNA deacylase n=1 Tax=Synoicihabitans lomoniglobus TaxID=2909285 RepID=A0AAF0CSX0_9BACT|nr:D-aminoacyl-tRNA deacylase [Opitutaceae bacterium LMO-M01]WED67443.1 D-aminoacyl-tRNA deacylase [Opitutaceae bacterium LMO-M01]
MRVVIQRVTEASVTIGPSIAGEIGPGLLIFLGVGREDTAEDGRWLAEKIAKLRIFPDADGNMNRSLLDTGGQALVVSQFTLHARTRKGTRPSFNDAAPPAVAAPLYDTFKTQLQTALGNRPVAAGEFGAMMAVRLLNDGPVTIIIDTKQKD